MVGYGSIPRNIVYLRDEHPTADVRLWSGWQWLLRYGGANGSTACELFSFGSLAVQGCLVLLDHLQPRTRSNKYVPQKNIKKWDCLKGHLHSFWCRSTLDCDETLQRRLCLAAVNQCRRCKTEYVALSKTAAHCHIRINTSIHIYI